jgi:hypothetical protein
MYFLAPNNDLLRYYWQNYLLAGLKVIQPHSGKPELLI